MSVLIKGMEMPKCCCECSLEYDCIFCRATGNNFITDKGGYIDFTDTRMPDCPLIEIPDGHGDLIDRDWMLENWFIYLHPRTMIEDAPTVIPADNQGGDA